MDNAEREAHLESLLADADGPTQAVDIRESSLGKALLCAVLALLVAALGLYMTLTSARLSAHLSLGLALLLWGVSLGLIVAGVAGLGLAEALRRRHGQRILAITADTLCFANSPQPVPLAWFDGLEVHQRHLHTALVFTIAAQNPKPELRPTRFKGLASPDASLIPGGLWLRVWACSPSVAGRSQDVDQLVQLLWPYLKAAMARRMLGLLYPEVARVGSVR